eukprot:5135394-Lingulodinium_polyedra.AAC.1
MMRSSQPYAGATACKSHARALDAHARELGRARTAQARLPTAAPTRGRFGRIIARRLRKAPQ